MVNNRAHTCTWDVGVLQRQGVQWVFHLDWNNVEHFRFLHVYISIWSKDSNPKVEISITYVQPENDINI